MIHPTQTKLRLPLIALSTAIALVACTGQNQTPNPTSGKIAIDGSSTVYPISDAVAKEFRNAEAGKNVEVDVQFSGTSGGFRKFCAGETDISNASRPILTAEADACVKAGVGFIELPIGFDALTLAVNSQNDWAKDLTVAELKTTWESAAQGKITRWNQVRTSFPDRPLKLFGAGKDSGTFDYFNEAIMGDKSNTRTDFTSSEDDNDLVNGISKDPNALGYVPFAYYKPDQNKLRALAIDNGKGAITPSVQAVQTAQYQPLSRPLFIYVNAKAAQDKPDLRSFVEFYLKNAKNLVASVGYVPLTEDAYQLADIQFIRGEIGTAFKGVPEPGVTIQEVLRRQVQFQASQETGSAQK